MCRLRMGDSARGRAVRGSAVAVADWVHTFTQPLIALLLTRGGRTGYEPASDAYRALHTDLAPRA